MPARKMFTAIFCILYLAAACTPVTPMKPVAQLVETGTPSIPTIATRTPAAKTTHLSVATNTISPTITPPPTHISQPGLPGGLVLEEYELKENSPFNKFRFEPAVGSRKEIIQRYDVSLIAERKANEFIPDPLIKASFSSHKLMLEGKEIQTIYTTDKKTQSIQVILDGQEIYSFRRDYSYNPIMWGFWTYGNHWVMEIVKVDFTKPKKDILDYTYGDIIWDGISTNEKYGYQESFGLQTLNGRIFYFFRKNDEYGIFYDDQTVSLGYSSIEHYNFCCESGPAMNPGVSELHAPPSYIVSFLAEREEKKYYAVIWLP
jgi:hypothetical protein